jgi:hypothetical protein
MAGVTVSRIRVTGDVQVEIMLRKLDRIDATCPRSPLLEGAGVVRTGPIDE